MQLPSALSWLIDSASTVSGADRLLAELGIRLIADGVPLAGGALTLAVPDPIIARRTWLWRAETGAVIEALGFAGPMLPSGDAGRGWLASLAPGEVQEDAAGAGSDAPILGWIGPRALSRPRTPPVRPAGRVP